MIVVRRSADRCLADHGWLKSRHTFSFADYRDPAHMGFSVLRVINEDRVAPGGGFAPHSHRDMEIVSYVVSGALEHRDSMGNGSVIRPGDVQVMRAGTGVTHSEYNHSPEEPVHFLQVWILPERGGAAPSYGQKHFPEAERRGALRVVVSRDGRDGSLAMQQDASIHAGLLDAGASVAHTLAPDRCAWVQVVSGSVELGGVVLEEGDGAAVFDESRLDVLARASSELLVFDLPASR